MGKCTSCGGGSSSPPAEGSVTVVARTGSPVDFTARTTNVTRIRLSTGQMQTIKHPLLKMKPPVGWGMTVMVAGHEHKVDGKTPHKVIDAVMSLYAINGIQIEDRDVWLNANIHWLSTMSIKHGLTTVADLLAISSDGEPQEPELDVFPPQSWGGDAWRLVKTYIAADSFDSIEFFSLLNVLRSMLNDEFLGCVECADHFRDALTVIFDTENVDAITAAHWVHATMNNIREIQERPTVSWEQAVILSRWERLLNTED